MRDPSNHAVRRTISDAEAREAFGELVRRYQGAATAYAYALLRNYAGAEDAAQAAFLSAWLHRDDLREPQAFGGWLRTIVRTECSRIARRTRLVTVPIDTAFAERPEPSTGDTRDWELRQQLLKAINALPEPDRALIALRYLSDFSYQGRYCEFLELPLSTVKKRLHDARKRLRIWLLTSASEERTRQVMRRPPDVPRPRLEERIMQLTEFLDSVARGDVAAVAAALDAHPEWLDATGDNQRKWHAGWNAFAVAAVSGQAGVARLPSCSWCAYPGGGQGWRLAHRSRRRGRPPERWSTLCFRGACPSICSQPPRLVMRKPVAAFLRGNPALVRECAYRWKNGAAFLSQHGSGGGAADRGCGDRRGG